MEEPKATAESAEAAAGDAGVRLWEVGAGVSGGIGTPEAWMNSVRSACLRESNTCPTQAGHFEQKRPTQAGRSYGRIPADVLLDKRLSDGAVRAYGILALRVFGGNSTTIGMRYLGQTVGRSKSTAERWLKELERAGYIARKRGGRGARNGYEFTSAIFKGVSAPGVSGSAQPVLCCANCHRVAKALGESGYCRTCVSDANRMRQWRAAQVELGPDATEEQIAQHLNIRKLTAGWRKVMKRAQAA